MSPRILYIVISPTPVERNGNRLWRRRLLGRLAANEKLSMSFLSVTHARLARENICRGAGALATKLNLQKQR